MKRIASLILAVAALAAFATIAAAGTPVANQRQQNQHQRIQQGVVSGELTPAEAARLREGQRDVRQMKRVARADGKITGRERAVIQQKQDKESAKIARLKHNERSR
jgi:uncharacterized membrane protein YebE (DUF533 family)